MSQGAEARPWAFLHMRLEKRQGRSGGSLNIGRKTYSAIIFQPSNVCSRFDLQPREIGEMVIVVAINIDAQRCAVQNNSQLTA